MVANGNGRNPYAGLTTKELVAAIEADIARERREEELSHREALEALLAATNEKLAALTAPPPLRRSQMSAKEKSDYFTKFGKDEYFKLPWT